MKAGGTTPPLAVEAYERAKATEGFEALRRWRNLRPDRTLHTSIWSLTTHRHITLVWACLDDPDRWTWVAATDVPNPVGFDIRTILDLDEASAAVESLFQEEPWQRSI